MARPTPSSSPRPVSSGSALAFADRPASSPLALSGPRALALAVAFGLGGFAACATDDAAEADDDPAPATEADDATGEAADAASDELGMWNERIERYAPVEITTDTSSLPESERLALMEIIEASRLLNPVFDRQAWAQNPELMAKLDEDQSELGQAKRRYVQIHRGPWDRQREHEAFAAERERPAGAGFYPEDMTKEEFKQHLEENPGDEAAFESLFTLIRRDDAGKLIAVPYRDAFAEWLKPAAEHLRAAAGHTANPSLKKFLNSRADAFESDDYYVSDKDWMDLDSLVEVTIGPYEVYEDGLFGLKASYESFVTVTDPAASEKLAKYKEMLGAMEQNLPVPDEVKAERGRESPIRVVDLVFTAGDARKSVQTIAFNLPNDERVRKEKGAKKVMLRNSIEAKFDKIMRPIAERILDGEQLAMLSADAFFNEVLFHELSHSLGPAFTQKDGKDVEVRVALESSYSSIEEAKADVMGAYNILFMIEKGEFPATFKNQLLVTYFAGLFRSVRFGVTEAHGRGAAMQINKILEAGGASFDDATATFTVDLAKLEQAISDITRDLCMTQHNGDKAAADAMLDKYGVMSAPMEKALGKLGGIPVDIRPIYPVAGETP